MEKEKKEEKSFGSKGKRPYFPKTEIRLVVGATTQDDKEFKTPIEIKVVSGWRAISGAQIRVKKDTNVLMAHQTDSNGEILYIHKEPLSAAEKTFTLRFALSGQEAVENSITVPLPAAQTQQQKESLADDPENLFINQTYNKDGDVTISVRVTKKGGVGISVPVVVHADGQQHTVKTNKQGIGSLFLGKFLKLGETKVIKAFISVVAEAATLKLRRPKTKKPVKNFWKWLIFKNNGRAVLFIGVAALLWIFCFAIGWGDSILNPPQTELSQQQQMYNEIVVGVNPNLIIAPEIPKGDWQKPFWIFAFIWMIFSLIYAPLSLREEIAHGLREGLGKIKEKTSSEAVDPFFDRLAARVGAYGAARKTTPKIMMQSQEATAEAPRKKHLTFWDVFKSDIISEILADLIPAIAKAIFKR